MITFRSLEILQDMWISDCHKEEQTSYSRWRYTEAWLLDYEKNYGKDVLKQKKPRQIQSHNQQTSRKSYASAVRNKSTPDPTDTVNPSTATTESNHRPLSSSERRGSMNQHRNIKIRNQSYHADIPQKRPIHRHPKDKIRWNQRNNRHKEYDPRNVRKRRPQNFYRNERITYIGRGVRNYFLGGGKPSQGQRHRN